MKVTINYHYGMNKMVCNVKSIGIDGDGLYFGEESSMPGGSFHHIHINPEYVHSVIINGYEWMIDGWGEDHMKVMMDIVDYYDQYSGSCGKEVYFE